MSFVVDWDSQHGFRQAAKKKKKAAAAPAPKPPPADGGDKKDDSGNGGDAGGGGANGGDAGGASGGGGDGGDGDGNGDKDQKGDDAPPDDDWLTPAKSKKKGKKDAEEAASGSFLPDVPADDFGGGSFQDIKLGDDGLGLDAPPPAGKSSSFGAWGSSWNTGGTGAGWGFSGASKDKDGGGDAKEDDNPWGSKPKKDKTSLSFGFGDDPPKDEGDSWADFSTATSKKDKKKKKSSFMDDFGTPDAPAADPEPEQSKDDEWGIWGTSKDKKKGRGAQPGLCVP